MNRATQITISIEPAVLVGLLVSLLIHVLLTIALLRDRPSFIPPETISVELIQQPPARQKQPEQIISEQPKQPVPDKAPETNQLSDEDRIVPKEQIHRGDGGVPSVSPPAPAVKPQPQQQQPSREQPARQQSAARQTGPKSLLLDRDTVSEKFAPPKSARPSEDEQTGNVASAAKPFSRPSGSGAAFLNSFGSNDYLPSLPDGDLTMLNAKASRFAVFVRRVAVQVFSQLRSQGWDRLRGGDIVNASNGTLVRAIMSPQGKLLKVELEQPSGSPRFDDVVLDAVRAGTRDPNPPPGCFASDGNVHFIFESKSWVASAPDPRSGAISELRWLFLGTGLE